MDRDPKHTRLLLCLYECIVDHRHLEQLMALVGDWLSEDENLPHLPVLEANSQTVLEHLVEITRLQRETANKPGTPDLLLPNATSATIVLGEIERVFKIEAQSDGLPALKGFLNGSKSYHLVAGSGPDGGDFVLLTKPQDHSDQIAFWGGEHEIDGAVAEILTSEMGISYSELLVLRHIAKGGRTADIAKSMGKSVETIRSQIKAISAKIGVSGQLQAVGRLRKLEAVARKSKVAQEAVNPELETLRLADGRTLAFARYGPPDAQPVLFFHCFLHGRHLPGSIQDTLRKMKLQIVSPSRPGFGPSSPTQADPRELLDHNANDYAALVRGLNLGASHLLAHGTGFATAFRFAVLYPELARKLIGLDAIPPTSTMISMQSLKGLLRSSALAAKISPATFSLFVQLVVQRLSSFRSPDKKMRRHVIYPNIALDQIETPEGLDAAARNVREMMANDLRPCVAEAQALSTNWSVLPTNANTRPHPQLYYTNENPFISRRGAERFASKMNAQITSLGPTFPFLTPHLEKLFHGV